MKPSDAYMVGWLHGCKLHERDESNIPEKCLAAYGDGFEAGQSHRMKALYTAAGFDVLDEVNKKAFELWNLDGCHPELPSPPSGSGCRFHYCWMPVDTKGDNHFCKAHGGKDAPFPKKKGKI